MDLIGCGPSERDTDDDAIVDALDDCPGTNVGAKVDVNGCSDSQKDSDGDGVKDDVDAFPDDASESSDRDGDGVGDNSDAYPDDPSASLDGELDSPVGLIVIIFVVSILALGGGALLFLRSGAPDGVQALAAVGEQSSMFQAEQTLVQQPVTQTEPEQFVDEQGNHWIRQPDGSMLWWNGTEWQQV